MRYATKAERRKILSYAEVDQKWLAPDCTLRGRTHRLFSDPGYVLIFETSPWKNCALVVSEPIAASNIIKGERFSRIDVHPSTRPDIPAAQQEVKWSGWYIRNVLLLNRRVPVFRKRNCALIAPGAGMAEWQRIFAIQTGQGHAKSFVLMPDEALECGDIRLPGLSPIHSVFLCGQRSATVSLRFNLNSGWQGVEAVTRKAIVRSRLRGPKNK